ncbi:MAG: hypothetical protein JWN04_5084 [Myxococcaceae bacterium]|nr:hypothetical protein [Myxococcaceae bacterium]
MRDVLQHACEEDGATHDAISAVIGVSRERVRQIEKQASLKFRIGILLFEELGKRRGIPVVESLKHKPLSAYRQALRAAREEAQQ